MLAGQHGHGDTMLVQRHTRSPCLWPLLERAWARGRPHVPRARAHTRARATRTPLARVRTRAVPLLRPHAGLPTRGPTRAMPLLQPHAGLPTRVTTRAIPLLHPHAGMPGIRTNTSAGAKAYLALSLAGPAGPLRDRRHGLHMCNIQNNIKHSGLPFGRADTAAANTSRTGTAFGLSPPKPQRQTQRQQQRALATATATATATSACNKSGPAEPGNIYMYIQYMYTVRATVPPTRAPHECPGGSLGHAPWARYQRGAW